MLMESIAANGMAPKVSMIALAEFLPHGPQHLFARLRPIPHSSSRVAQ